MAAPACMGSTGNFSNNVLTRRLHHFQACLRGKAARAMQHGPCLCSAASAQPCRWPGWEGARQGRGLCARGRDHAALVVHCPPCRHASRICLHLCTTLDIISWKQIKIRARLLTAGMDAQPT
jgi:hypothetical protein